MGIQKIIDYLYRYPLSKIRQIKRFGGLLSYVKMKRDEAKMKTVAWWLPKVVSHDDGLPIYMLTGKNYIHQTLYFIKSLVKHNDERFKIILVDDGSFDEALVQKLLEQLPGVVLVTQAEIEKNLSLRLPKSQFPHIYKKRAEYPHLKKLTDIHTLSYSAEKLVLDSDMLCWQCMPEVMDWLKKPDGAICMQDCQPSYGYSPQLMNRLAGAHVKPLINVGLIGFPSRWISWTDLEFWIAELEKHEGASYYLEQALTAMILVNRPLNMLPAIHYQVNPKEMEEDPAFFCTLHHYVDLSKKYYLTTAWKKV